MGLKIFFFLLESKNFRIGNCARGVLSDSIEPAVQRTLSREEEQDQGGGGRGVFKFERTDLGSLPPKISNVKVHRGEEKEKEEDGVPCKQVFLDFDVEYLGDCDLRVSIFGIGSGVR